MSLLSYGRFDGSVLILDVLSCMPARAMYAVGLTATTELGCVGELNNAVPVRVLISIWFVYPVE